MGTMKNLFKYAWAISAVAFMVWICPAQAGVFPLPLEEQANTGATHVYIVKSSDFTQTTNGVSQTFDWAIGAKQSVEFVSMELKTAVTGLTNCTVSVGDEDSTNRFLSATVIASDDTEVFFAFATAAGGTVALTPSTVVITSISALTGGVVTNVSDIGTTKATNTVWTGATAAFTATGAGRLAYTATKQIRLTFTPVAGEHLTSATAGEVFVYFKRFDAAK